MGIVSSRITDQWYKKGFIYDNFKYIFKNPLWSQDFLLSFNKW